MSQVKIAELAEQFMEKIAAHHYEEHAPEDKKASDIDWITDEERRLIKRMALTQLSSHIILQLP